MKVRFKKVHPDAVTPSYSKIGDAGLDLTAVSNVHADKYVEYATGIAIEIPEGYVGLLMPRSSVTDKNMVLKNSVGVIDSNFRGEMKVRFKAFSHHTFGTKKIYDDVYKKGDRVGQLVIVPAPFIELEEVPELSETNRGTDGYGSTGN